MKIIREDAVYVQIDDIAFLFQVKVGPESIFKKSFNKGIVKILKVTNENRFDFIKFIDPHEIEFFRTADYLVDYDEVKDLTRDEIVALAYSIQEEVNRIACEYEALPECESEKKHNLSLANNLLARKVFSLKDTLEFLEGRIPMNLPDGIELPPRAYRPKPKRKPSAKNFVMKMLDKNKGKTNPKPGKTFEN